MIIPVEVKAGAVGKLRSLHQFIEASPHDWAVRFYSDKFNVQDVQTVSGVKYKLINLPHYLAGKLGSILEQIIG